MSLETPTTPGADPRARWKRLGLAVAIFAVTTVVTTYPLSRHPSSRILANADAMWFAWDIAWIDHSLIHDPLGLLKANIFYPDPAAFTYNEPQVIEGLLGLPVYAVTGNDVLTLNVVVMLTFTMVALAMFLLAMEVTGHVGASIVAGQVYAFTTANFDSVARVQVLSSQWTPLVFLFLIRLLRRRRMRDAVGLGVAFVLQALSCEYYMLFLGLLLLLTFPAFWWIVPRPRLRSTPWLGLMLSGVIVTAALVPVGLLQTGHLSRVDTARPLREGAMPSSYFQTMPENWLYGRWMARGEVPYDDRFFLGFATMALASLGAVAVVRRRRADRANQAETQRQLLIPFLWLGVLSLALATGRDFPTPWGAVAGPYQLLHHFVPGFDLTRVPSRFVVFGRVTLALLAGVGAATLITRHRRLLSPALVGGLLILLPAEHLSVPLPCWTISSGDRVPFVYRWLAEQPGEGAVLEFPPNPIRFRRHEVWWMHYSTYHWHPLVNGFSSFFPLHFDFVINSLLRGRDGFPSNDTLGLLGRLGVKYVIVHEDPWSTEGQVALARFKRRLATYQDRIVHVRSFDDSECVDKDQVGSCRAKVYRLRQPSQTGRPKEVAWHRVDLSRAACQAPGSESDCRRALDGDVHTDFESGESAANHRPVLRVFLDTPVRVTGVGLVTGLYSRDYPRRVRVRGFVDGRWLPLAPRLDVVGFLDDMLERPESAEMRFALGKPRLVEALEISVVTRRRNARLHLAELAAYADAPRPGRLSD